MELIQLNNAKAFPKAEDHILIKMGEPIGLTVNFPVAQERREIAFFMVHDDRRHQKKTIKGNALGTVPAFRIKEPKGMKVKFIHSGEFGRVVARIGSVPIEAQELALTVVFHVLSNDRLNSGNIHSLRQWNFITYIKGCMESEWKILSSLPIQVCKEITGTTRDPSLRKRKKRPNSYDRVNLTGGRHGLGFNESITNVSITYLREVITPSLIDNFKALTQCTCQEMGPNVDDELKNLHKLLAVLRPRTEVEGAPFVSEENKNRERNATIILNVPLKDIVDENFSG